MGGEMRGDRGGGALWPVDSSAWKPISRSSSCGSKTWRKTRPSAKRQSRIRAIKAGTLQAAAARRAQPVAGSSAARDDRARACDGLRLLRAQQLARLGEDVTEVLEKVPARLKVIRHIRPRYACRLCEAVFQAPAPDFPIERGRPGPSLIAHVAVSKYCDGLPLFRQSVILAREGVEIDRVTLADWIGRAAWWLAPLARLIGTMVMAQPVLHTDDTPIRTLAPGIGKTRLSGSGSTPSTRAPILAPDPPAAFYRFGPTAKGSVRAIIWPGSAASSMPTRLPAMTPCMARAGQARSYPARGLLGPRAAQALRRA